MAKKSSKSVTASSDEAKHLPNLDLHHHDIRQTGDGESEPHTPPSEEANLGNLHHFHGVVENVQESTDFNLTEFSFSLKLDIVAILLFGLSAATRFYNLTYPHNIVFDELHYGKYASLYLRRIFFFDPHPPFGKQLIAASASLFDPSYNGTFKFDRIGAPYPEWVPVFGLRFIPALTGSLIPPISYSLAKHIGISHIFAFFTGILLIFDNALLIQSRYVLMEMPMIFFGILSIIFAVKFTKEKHHSPRSLVVTAFSALCGTLSMSIKYVGGFYPFISFAIIFSDLWRRLVPRKDLLPSRILRIMASVCLVFSSVSIITYIGIFYIHLTTLTNAGPHDSVMTSAFQASLKGGLASIIRGQPHEVAHGSQVTLRHALGRACWLHSHPHNYPIKYSDKRGSSHQQQVTCYSFKDVNNWWIVKRPNVDNLGVNETKDFIKNGEEIHLVHGMTGRLLNSHDVAAPVTPQNQEVSCYIDHNVSMSAEPLWRVEIINGCDGKEKCIWEAVSSTVRLIHVATGQALRMSGKQLPSWGFNQHEVVTDRIIAQDDTIWNVEEHRYTKSEKDREKELLAAEMIPTEPTTLSFWSKFLELQMKMLFSSSGTAGETHSYSSTPGEWLLLNRGIAYWIGVGNNAQIHLLGNPVLWFTGAIFLLVNSAIILTHLLLQRRQFYYLPQQEWTSLTFQSAVFGGGYLLTYGYHFCLDKTLFLHHYLPSYVFKILLFVTTLNHLQHYIRGKWVRSLFGAILLVWIGFLFHSFSVLSPLSYGHPSLTRSELEGFKWRSNWDFIIQTDH